MTARVRILVYVGLIMASVFIWLVGLFGVGRMSEDACFPAMGDQRYGAYHQSVEGFPPTVTCTLLSPYGASSPEQLKVSLRGLSFLGWVVGFGFPVFWLAVVVAVALWRPRGRPESPVPGDVSRGR